MPAGYLIDATWIAPEDVAMIEYMLLNPSNNTWVPIDDLKRWTGTPENSRAMRITLRNGTVKLFERPKKIQQNVDLRQMLNDNSKAASGSPI